MTVSPKNARLNVMICVFVLCLNISEIISNCKSGGKRYRTGSIWYSDNGCLVHECGKGSKVTDYKKICPDVPPCLAPNVYTKGCCQYCHQRGLPKQNNGNDCKRECKSGQAMSCKYSFSAEVFQTLSLACFNCPANVTDCDREGCIPVDGITRLVNVANRMIPGPAIEVCLGDTVVVDVQNGFISQSVSIQWVGMKHRKDPYQDGVPFVSQCPVSDFSQYRYVFEADSPGTHKWQASVGLEMMDGFQGPLIVRQPKDDDLVGDRYDHDEHIMYLQDWNHQYSENKFYSHYMTNASQFPDNILINGRGRYVQREKPPIVYSSESELKPIPEIPYAEFRVQEDKRYRFRIINGATSECPFVVSIDKHLMTLISIDGSDVVPLDLYELAITNGERYDVVVETDQPVDKYWIHVRGLLKCEQLKLQQFAILRYEGSSAGDPEASMDYDFSNESAFDSRTVHSQSFNFDAVYLTDYTSLEPLEHGLETDFPDHQFYLNLNYTTVKNSMLMASPDSPEQETFQINRITYKHAPSPLMIHPLENTSMQCNDASLKAQNKDCSKELCSCVHVLNVDLNSTVEIILFDPDTKKQVEHTFHLHGYRFRVISQGRIPQITEKRIKKFDKAGEIDRNFNAPVFKDTVSVPKSGYTIIRFRASNPGYWFFPTTIRFHQAQGMLLLLKVGERPDWPRPPPGVPTCFDYLAT